MTAFNPEGGPKIPTPPPAPKRNPELPEKEEQIENLNLPTKEELIASLEISEPEVGQEIDNGLGIFFEKKTLFHGSPVKGIEKINPAEETTVGNGVYLTPDAKSAAGYAEQRTVVRPNAPRVVYKTEVFDVRLMDLTKDANVQAIAPEFAAHLAKSFKDEKNFFVRELVRNTMPEIYSGKIRAGTVKSMAGQFGRAFSEYVSRKGYDGLVTEEGGEGDIGDHISYVIFNSEKIEIVDEKEFR